MDWKWGVNVFPLPAGSPVRLERFFPWGTVPELSDSSKIIETRGKPLFCKRAID